MAFDNSKIQLLLTKEKLTIGEGESNPYLVDVSLMESEKGNTGTAPFLVPIANKQRVSSEDHMQATELFNSYNVIAILERSELAPL